MSLFKLQNIHSNINSVFELSTFYFLKNNHLLQSRFLPQLRCTVSVIPTRVTCSWVVEDDSHNVQHSVNLRQTDAP